MCRFINLGLVDDKDFYSSNELLWSYSSGDTGILRAEGEDRGFRSKDQKMCSFNGDPWSTC